MKAVGKLYEISPQEARKKLRSKDGNRKVDESNVRKIMRSMQIDGWIGDPVTLSKDYYVISGQHRVEAACRVGINIKYIFSDTDVTVEQIQRQANAMKKWSAIDYARSFADIGNENYRQFCELHKEFVVVGKVLTTNTILAVMTRNYEATDSSIKSGQLSVDLKSYSEFRQTLYSIQECVRPIRESQVKTGRIDYICKAILFMMDHNVDIEKLARKIADKPMSVRSVANVEQALEILEDLYNKNLKGDNKRYFMSDYKQYRVMRVAAKKKK